MGKYENKGLLDGSDSDEEANYYKKINKVANNNKTEDDYESKGKYSDFMDDEAQSSQ